MGEVGNKLYCYIDVLIILHTIKAKEQMREWFTSRVNLWKG